MTVQRDWWTYKISSDSWSRSPKVLLTSSRIRSPRQHPPTRRTSALTSPPILTTSAISTSSLPASTRMLQESCQRRNKRRCAQRNSKLWDSMALTTNCYTITSIKDSSATRSPSTDMRLQTERLAFTYCSHKKGPSQTIYLRGQNTLYLSSIHYLHRFILKP